LAKDLAVAALVYVPISVVQKHSQQAYYYLTQGEQALAVQANATELWLSGEADQNQKLRVRA
jgi:hypothetical protein